MTDKIVAVTGGIGCGKSAVINIIKELGFTVLSADEEYALLLNDPSFVRKIHNIAGIESGDTLDRKAVSFAVFNDSVKLKALNEFTHAKIYEKLFEKSKGMGLVFHEVPLLFESGKQDDYYKVIVVKRNLEDRINSVVLRSGLTREEVEKRIKNQFNYENLDENKHTVIYNDKDLQSLAVKVKAVVNEI